MISGIIMDINWVFWDGSGYKESNKNPEEINVPLNQLNMAGVFDRIWGNQETESLQWNLLFSFNVQNFFVVSDK